MTPSVLRSLFPPTAYFYAADESYAKPTLAWLLDEFWMWFWRDRTDKGLLKWTRRNDCDGFARSYAQSAQDCHAITAGNTDDGLAVGQFFYHQDIGGAHAIVAAVTEVGVVFIEPQTGKRLKLTDKEISTCFLVLF